MYSNIAKETQNATSDKQATKTT